MNLYLAPMEELTGFIFRNTLNKHFGYVDKYFTPFITPNQNKILKTKDGREIIPEHNEGLNVVPQVLTNDAEHFVELAHLLIELGYKEININCGCPSGTVVKKNRGSGLFNDLYILERLLEGIFSSDISGKVDISVKTRVGLNDTLDFEDIMRVYNKFPISELTIHPRIGQEFYKGSPHMDMFEYGLNISNTKVCYNGDVYTVEAYQQLIDQYASKNNGNLSGVMIGRGAIANPGIFREVKTGQKQTVEELRAFHDDLFETYASTWSEKDAMFKMKEVWSYLGKQFADIDKPLKRIKKSNNKSEFMAGVNEAFRAEYLGTGYINY